MVRDLTEIRADIADVRDSIKRTLTNQSYSEGNTQVQRAWLKEQREYLNDLLAEERAAINEASGEAGGIAFTSGRIAR
jgi:hypothetical protein